MKKYAKQLVQALVAMTSRIMQPKMTEELIDDIDRHVKIFLSTICMLQKETNKFVSKEKRLKVETTSNLSGLLNLKSYIRDYGPLRLYWEGGYKGEGLLRFIKPMVKQGVHKSTFAQNLLTNFYKDRFLQILIDLNVEAGEDTQDGEEREETDVRYTKFRTYKNVNNIHDSIQNGNAISIIISKNTKLYVSHYNGKEHKICQIITDDDTGKSIDATYITKLSLGSSENVDRKKLTKKENVEMWGLALPYHTKEDGSHMYYIITDTWKQRVRDAVTKEISFLLPRVDGCTY